MTDRLNMPDNEQDEKTTHLLTSERIRLDGEQLFLHIEDLSTKFTQKILVHGIGLLGEHREETLID